jgi:hypothetical protein
VRIHPQTQKAKQKEQLDSLKELYTIPQPQLLSQQQSHDERSILLPSESRPSRGKGKQGVMFDRIVGLRRVSSPLCFRCELPFSLIVSPTTTGQ